MPKGLQHFMAGSSLELNIRYRVFQNIGPIHYRMRLWAGRLLMRLGWRIMPDPNGEMQVTTGAESGHRP